MCNFHVGQKVVCIDADIDYLGIFTNLRHGAVYTVEAISVIGDQAGLVVSGAYSWHFTKAYCSSRFRPVVEHGTEKSMSILRELLNKQTQTVGEPA